MKVNKTKYVAPFYLGLILLISCTKAKESYPELIIEDATQTRSESGSIMSFNLNINKSVTNTISVDYSILDGTAISPQDFIATSGVLSIPANQTHTALEVQIKGNPLNSREPNLEFTVQLSNPEYCTIANTSAKGTIITENSTNLSTDNAGYTTPVTYPGYSLVWSDEFSGTNLDLSVWNQEIGNGNNGWGNNELEYYTNSTRNTFVSSGNLIIEARRETFGDFLYTSGRMTTQGKKYFKFGRIDIRAKLPYGQGIWPALWMLGINISSAGWPACGEIDIMELIGSFPGRVTGTMHWKPLGASSTNKGANYSLSSGDFSQQFHVFSIVWTQDNIKWYVDDQLFLNNTAFDVGSANYPFNAEQFFIFNVAVGGNWPGAPDYTTLFPQRMFVDYIRVFQ